MVGMTWGWGGSWHLVVEAREAAQHPTVPRVVPNTQNDPAPDISGAKAENPCVTRNRLYNF